MSSDLTWLLVKNWNSHQRTRTTDGTIFSLEPGNVRNIQSRTFSGLANEKVFDIKESKGTVEILARTDDARPNQVKPSFTSTKLRRNAGPKHIKEAIDGYAERGYNPRLRKIATRRIAALIRSTHPPKIVSASESKKKSTRRSQKTVGKKKAE
ncbi:ribosomal L28e protein family-domain-containing protein [Cantharellus anzutake]|uniref:ribosomal L28e protein family-domain-containing protein n=1 Tax=Cantharellus anzutake TaxID=1750568 RepID=UPI0019051411|nr:ribosomal L28e protein family-domain-containing protein [Cantharellus anzutake]KAF8333165.1 ribosomal L28e protein family-domain-containing protein [Cantharellus anzutake]